MRIKDKVIFLVIGLGLLFVSLNRHSHHPIFNYHSQLFADKAGYHIYFPAWFYYDMDARNLPDSISLKTGQGFWIKDSKILTKYPIGVAICQLPFSLIAALADEIQQIKSPLGFTKAHHLALNWSTAIWGTLGLLLVFLTAIQFWNLSYSQGYLLIFGVLMLSNLLYYTTRDCGMSHAYSFTVFAAIQYLLMQIQTVKKINNSSFSFLLILGSLVIVLRPLNLLFIIIPLLYIFLNKNLWKEIRIDVKPKILYVAIPLAFVPIVLQMSYNYYAFERLIADGYVNEGFSNIGQVNLLKLWFSPHNGLFIYSPIILIALVGVIKGWVNDNWWGIMYLFYFMIISLTYASWWSPGLGCGFGHRGFTEHLAFFAMPISWVLKTISKSQQRWWSICFTIIGVLLFIVQYNFDGCWPESRDWDWGLFLSYFKI